MSLSQLRRNWHPNTWAEIRSVWIELVPESDSIQPVITRHFLGRIVNNREAGYVFEDWVLAALKLAGFAGLTSFDVPRVFFPSQRLEQVDGLLFQGFQGFLIESKFLPGNVDFGPVAQLHVCVEQRPAGTLGLFFSAFDYTGPAQDLLLALRPIKVLLFSQADLVWGMDSLEKFQKMIKYKWLLALKDGLPYAPSKGAEMLDFFGI